MDEKIKFSVIILGYNSMSHIDDCLNSVLKTNYSNFEIIYVDNNSQDGSAQYVKENFGNKIKMLILDKNYKFTGGNNRGAKIAKGDVLVFLSTDTVVDKDWLKETSKNFFEESIGIVTPAVYNFSTKKLDSLGGGFTILGFHYLLKKMKKNFPFWASGCCLFIRKKIFEKLEGFDENFSFYCEDIDLSWRCWGLGYKVVCEPKSKIYHKGSISVKELKGKGAKSFVYYHQTRNMLWMLIKNSSLFSLIFSRVILNIIQIYSLFLTGNYESSKAVLKGLRDGLRYYRKPTKNPYPYILIENLENTLKIAFSEIMSK